MLPKSSLPNNAWEMTRITGKWVKRLVNKSEWPTEPWETITRSSKEMSVNGLHTVKAENILKCSSIRSSKQLLNYLKDASRAGIKV